MTPLSWLHPLLALALAPLLPGIVNRVKAWFAGRCGPPLTQPYRDIAKLFRKGAVISRTTTFVFGMGPVVGLATAGLAVTLIPFGGAPALLSFAGDLGLLAYLLGLLRFFTILAALDTGSSFEGMGSSREAAFSALAEPVLLLALATLVRKTGEFSLSAIFPTISTGVWAVSGPVLALVATSLFIVFLAENSRIPVDDPNTHLELTMIHEAMILDHGGPDLGAILYTSSLKLWIFGALVVGVMVPLVSPNPWINLAGDLAGMAGIAVVTGIVESSMARLRLLRVPQLLVGAGVLSALALLMVLR